MPKTGRPRVLTDEQARQALAAYRQGTSAGLLARRYGVSKNTIYHAMARAAKQAHG